MDQFLIDTLALIAGVILSFLVEIPLIKAQYDKLGVSGKRLVMFGLLVAAGAVLYGLACAALLGVLFPALIVTCDQAGLLLLVRVVLLAATTNQTTFSLFIRKVKPVAADVVITQPLERA